MSDETSFHDLLARLDDGQVDAQTEVFQRFAGRLVKLARARLDDRIRKTPRKWTTPWAHRSATTASSRKLAREAWVRSTERFTSG